MATNGANHVISTLAELEALFGPARAERFAGLAKSWVCVSPSAG